MTQRNLPIAVATLISAAHRWRAFQHVVHAHSSRRSWQTGPGHRGFDGVLRMPCQAFEVAQVGFDIQAQAEPMLVAQLRQEAVDLRVQLEAIRAFRHRGQDV